VSLKFNGAATGALRALYGVADGTPGTMSIIQITTAKVVGLAGRGDSGGVGITANYVTVLPAK
jgi:hypothetical protein